MERFKDIKEAGEFGGEFSYARFLLIGIADREDKLTFTRDGKPAISATVGWWADHTVKETARGPVFVRYEPFPRDRVRSQGPKLDKPAVP